MNIVDFCNKNYKELVKIFGNIGGKFFNSDFIDINGVLIERASGGLDEDWGIDISFDPRYIDSSNYDYGNDIDEVIINGRTIYCIDYLNFDHR